MPDFLPSIQELTSALAVIVVTLLALGLLEQNFPTVAQISKGQ